MEHAEHFGEVVQDRILAASSFNVKDIYRLWRILQQPKSSRVSLSSDPHKGEGVTEIDPDPEPTMDERDLKTMGLKFLYEFADFHERVFKSVHQYAYRTELF